MNDIIKFTKCDVFTPDNISLIMSQKINNYGTLLEPSVGSGNLLKYLELSKYSSIDLYEIKKEYLDNNVNANNIYKINDDFLRAPITKKYNNIIMNPPYIKVQDLSPEYREFLKANFTTLKTGLVDIYYAFILKCLDLLSNDGRMVAITPNSYLYNKSALNLRKLLFGNRYIEEIIDYNDAKVFKGISVYCCITVFTKKHKDTLKYNDITYYYNDVVKTNSLFNNKGDFGNSSKNTKKLKDICKIKNGIATLRDKIYIHQNKLNDEPCWSLITNGICEKYIIYPYNNAKIIDENEFKKDNPQTYNYLQENKEELSKRDKGNKVYASWYAYGRTQSIKKSNKECLYIPCFLDPKNLTITKNKDILHYGCLCIEPNDSNDLDYIKNVIIKNIDYITRNSQKRSGGWINVSSRVLNEIAID